MSYRPTKCPICEDALTQPTKQGRTRITCGDENCYRIYHRVRAAIAERSKFQVVSASRRAS